MDQRQRTSQDMDRSQRMKHNRTRARWRNLLRVLFLGFLMIFLGAVGTIGLRIYQDNRDAQAYEGLNSMLTTPVETQQPDSDDFGEADPDNRPEVIPTMEMILGDEVYTVLPKYQAVYAMNPDMFGWLSIDGMSFSYPVMYTPEDEEYYLRRGFDKNYARSGVPFMDKDCVLNCGNYIIYGHNMTNGTMFAQLLAYEEEAFWKEHPVIHFDTLFEEGEYEIIAAFYSRVFYKYEQNKFRFYEYTDLTNPDDFSEYVGEVLDLALYDTDVDIQYGDQLITLITCSYENRIENERFVVVARKRP